MRCSGVTDGEDAAVEPPRIVISRAPFSLVRASVCAQLVVLRFPRTRHPRLRVDILAPRESLHARRRATTSPRPCLQVQCRSTEAGRRPHYAYVVVTAREGNDVLARGCCPPAVNIAAPRRVRIGNAQPHPPSGRVETRRLPNGGKNGLFDHETNLHRTAPENSNSEHTHGEEMMTRHPRDTMTLVQGGRVILLNRIHVTACSESGGR